jgi:hypothetical protein
MPKMPKKNADILKVLILVTSIDKLIKIKKCLLVILSM